jgi:glutamine amidotransferase
MKNRKIVIIDYGLGNIRSMYNAIEYVNLIPPIITADDKIIKYADSLILPGVGAFGEGMKNINNLGLNFQILDFVKTGKPFLGVCLGMQMLFDESEEFGITKGLGLISGKVLKFVNEDNLKLPHIGWNNIEKPSDDRWNNTILTNINENSDMYFVHSYFAEPKHNENILSNTQYGNQVFCSAVNLNNVYGTQFHPEKSSKTGLQILENFIKLIN